MPKLKNKVVFSKRRIRTSKMCRIYSFRNLTCFFRLLAESTFLSFSVIICEFCRLGTKSGQGRYPEQKSGPILGPNLTQILGRFRGPNLTQIFWLGYPPRKRFGVFCPNCSTFAKFWTVLFRFWSFWAAFCAPNHGFTGFVGFSTPRNKVFWKPFFSKPETAAVDRLIFTLNSGILHFQLSVITFVIFWTGFQEISDSVRKSQAFSTGFQEISGILRKYQEFPGI